MSQGQGGGAPTKYSPKFDKKAYKLCLMGATDVELAEFFDVCEKTIDNWKNEHPKFLQSIKKGKEDADSNVSESLYKRALGYSHKDVDIKVVDGTIVETPLTKHYPPDTTAAIFWLKNRQPKKWRDKQEVETKNNTVVYSVELTSEEMRKYDADLNDEFVNRK